MIGELWDWLWSFLKANQFASGGVLIGMIGGVAVALRSVPGRIFRGLRRLLIVEVEVLDTDEAFQWLSLWLSRHHRPSRGRNLQVMTATRQSFLGPSVPQPVYSGQATKHDEKLPPIRLVPGIGRHLVWRSGWPILLHHYRDEGGGPGGDLMKMLIRPERFVLHGLVFSRKAMVKLLQAAREEAMPPPDRLRLFLGNYAAWTPLGEIDGRPLDTVILPEGVTDNLIRDIEQFRGRRDWYQHRGIPWRRGYLLSGPPGNGKTSLIRAVATHLGMHLGIVNLASTEASDTYLLELFTRAQSDMVVVIEDVDCLYDQRTRSKEVGSKISFSGLLNAIDGLASSNGRLLFLTTNHPEKIDEALMRPGRIDRKIEVPAPAGTQASRLFLLFHPERQELADSFARNTNGHSMAALQEHLLRHDDPKEAAILTPDQERQP